MDARLFFRSLVLVLALAAAVAGLLLLDSGDEEDPLRVEASQLREEIRHLQDRVDECLLQRGALEERFRNAVERTEALGARVEALESLDPDGVPADRYGEYLEVFDEYNASIPEWERLGEAVREQGIRCRRLADTHNRRLERLQEILVEVYQPPAPPG